MSKPKGPKDRANNDRSNNGRDRNNGGGNRNQIVGRLWDSLSLDQVIDEELLPITQPSGFQALLGEIAEQELWAERLPALAYVNSPVNVNSGSSGCSGGSRISLSISEEPGPLDLSLGERKPTDFQCSFIGCSKKFSTKKGLSQHEKSHKSPEGICKLCDPPKTFKYRDGLTTHRKTQHSKVLPYLCDIDGCEQAFNYSDELNEHRREMHSHCSLCGGRYASAAGLKLHLKTCRQNHQDSAASSNADSPSQNQPGPSKRTSGDPAEFKPKKLRHESRDSGMGSLMDEDTRSRIILEDSLSPEIIAHGGSDAMEAFKTQYFSLPTVAVALATLSAGASKVDSACIDEILNRGRRDYADIRTRKNLGVNETVRFEHLPEAINLTLDCPAISREVTFIAKPVFKARLGSKNDSLIIKCFSRFCSQFKYGSVKLGTLSLAIVFAEDSLYLLDPMGAGQATTEGSTRRAVLLKFKNFSTQNGTFDFKGIAEYLTLIWENQNTEDSESIDLSLPEFTIQPVAVV